MEIVYAVLAVIVAAMLVISARLKITRDERAVGVIGDIVGVPLSLFPVLAFIELAAAAGLVVGIAFAPLGLAAGIGLVVYFVGATAGHLRVGDRANLQPAVLMLALAVAVTAARLAA